MTDFADRVYGVVAGIPAGMVSTYAAVAQAAGIPGAARAVGQALRRNPFAPRVPCHRVIASDLSPGGFQGEVSGKAMERKLRLLAGEGVRFTGGVLEDRGRVWHFQGRGGR